MPRLFLATMISDKLQKDFGGGRELTILLPDDYVSRGRDGREGDEGELGVMPEADDSLDCQHVIAAGPH